MKPNYVKVVPIDGEAVYARLCRTSSPLNSYKSFVYFIDRQGIEYKMIEFDNKDMREVMARAVQVMFEAKQRKEEGDRVIRLGTEEFINDLSLYMHQLACDDERIAVRKAKRKAGRLRAALSHNEV